MSRANNTKKIIQLIFAMLMLAASGFVIYKNFTSDRKSFDLLDNPTANQQNVNSFQKAVQVLDDIRFKNLIKFGNWPVVSGEKGRANPFIKL
jgi:hypothetical protein